MWTISGRIASAAAVRRGPRELCRRLTLEGWSRLAAADDGGRGVLVLALRTPLWRLAMLAVGLYRGPLDVAGEAGADRLLGRLAARLEPESPIVTPLPGLEAIAERLAAGGRVGVLAGDPAAEARALRAALEAGAPALPVEVRPEPGRRYRLTVRAPVDPDR